MNVGIKRLNRSISHSMISDDYWEIQQLDIDGNKENPENQFNISKFNPTCYVGMRTSLNRKNQFINRKDWNSHGYED